MGRLFVVLQRVGRGYSGLEITNMIGKLARIAKHDWQMQNLLANMIGTRFVDLLQSCVFPFT
jgi:hypothetical protein